MIAQPKMIAASEVAFRIRDRKTFYLSMKRKYALPSVHSALATLEWMWGLRFGIYYCPLRSDQNYAKQCFYPPPKADLIEKLEPVQRRFIRNNPGKESKAIEETMTYMQDHSPDVNWLIIMMGIWKPDDEIFEPQYKYVKQKNAPIEAMFDNTDDFFTGTALLTDKDIRKHPRLRFPQDMRFDL